MLFWSFYINYLNSLVFSKLPICNAIKIIFKPIPNIYKKKRKKRKSIKIYSHFFKSNSRNYICIRHCFVYLKAFLINNSSKWKCLFLWVLSPYINEIVFQVKNNIWPCLVKLIMDNIFVNNKKKGIFIRNVFFIAMGSWNK